jgi:hypothetical protein
MPKDFKQSADQSDDAKAGSAAQPKRQKSMARALPSAASIRLAEFVEYLFSESIASSARD